MAAVTIASGAVLGVAATTTVGSGTGRLWVHDGNLYQVVVETADGDPHVYKSSDEGATWSVQDAADAPNGSSTASNRAVDSYVNGDNLYVAYVPATGTIAVSIFDMSTDQWGSSLGNATTAATTSRGMGIVVRSDNDVLVVFNSSADDDDVLYSRYEGSWTSDVSVFDGSAGAPATMVSGAIDSTDMAYFFYLFREPSNNSLAYRSLSSANSLGTQVIINSATSLTNDHTYSATYGIYDVGGTDTLFVAITDSVDDIDARVVTLESASDSGNLASAENNIHNGVNLGEGVIRTFRHDSTRYVFWSDVDDDDIIYISDSGSGWGTSASNQTVWQSLTGPTSLGFAGPLTVDSGTGVYVTWEDNGTVYGDWFIAPVTNVTVNGSVASISGAALAGMVATDITGSAASIASAALSGTLDIEYTATGDVASITGSALDGTVATDVTGSMATINGAAYFGLVKPTIQGSLSQINAAALIGLVKPTIQGSLSQINAAAYAGALEALITGSTAVIDLTALDGDQNFGVTVTGDVAVITMTAHDGTVQVVEGLLDERSGFFQLRPLTEVEA